MKTLYKQGRADHMQSSYRFKSMVVHDEAVLGVFAKMDMLRMLTWRYFGGSTSLSSMCSMTAAAPLMINNPSVACLPL